MSPTLLEIAVAIVVIALAWQIGVALAPDVFRLLRGMKRDIDDVTTEVMEDEHPQTDTSAHKEGHDHGTQ